MDLIWLIEVFGSKLSSCVGDDFSHSPTKILVRQKYGLRGWFAIYCDTLASFRTQLTTHAQFSEFICRWTKAYTGFHLLLFRYYIVDGIIFVLRFHIELLRDWCDASYLISFPASIDSDEFERRFRHWRWIRDIPDSSFKYSKGWYYYHLW